MRKLDQKCDGGEEKAASREGGVGREEPESRCLERAEVCACLSADQEGLVAGWPHPGLVTGWKCALLHSTRELGGRISLLFYTQQCPSTKPWKKKYKYL